MMGPRLELSVNRPKPCPNNIQPLPWLLNRFTAVRIFSVSPPDGDCAASPAWLFRWKVKVAGALADAPHVLVQRAGEGAVLHGGNGHFHGGFDWHFAL